MKDLFVGLVGPGTVRTDPESAGFIEAMQIRGGGSISGFLFIFVFFVLQLFFFALSIILAIFRKRMAVEFLSDWRQEDLIS